MTAGFASDGMARRNFLRLLGVLAAGAATARAGTAFAAPAYVADRAGADSFPLVTGKKAAALVVSGSDHPGVIRVAGDLQADIERVSGIRPALHIDEIPQAAQLVLIGSIDRSPLVRDLISAGRLDVTGVVGKWETSHTEVVSDPRPGVARALVITGSDQRGTIFGAYDLSRQLGVSPWHWWDDVPVAHQDELHVAPGPHSLGTPVVKYRGLFINGLLRSRARVGPRRRLQSQVLREGLRAHAAAAGELPVAGGVGPCLRRGRPTEPCDRNSVRHCHGHIARSADVAGHRGVEPARRGRRA
jgi:hypothetical protein